MVHVRVDERLKAQAAETLASMNLTFFDAIRAFLIRVVASKWLPFAPKATHPRQRTPPTKSRSQEPTRHPDPPRSDFFLQTAQK
jgi:DNA-damage-inducible protein J